MCVCVCVCVCVRVCVCMVYVYIRARGYAHRVGSIHEQRTDVRDIYIYMYLCVYLCIYLYIYGKSPVIVDRSADLDHAAMRIV